MRQPVLRVRRCVLLMVKRGLVRIRTHRAQSATSANSARIACRCLVLKTTPARSSTRVVPVDNSSVSGFRRVPQPPHTQCVARTPHYAIRADGPLHWSRCCLALPSTYLGMSMQSEGEAPQNAGMAPHLNRCWQQTEFVGPRYAPGETNTLGGTGQSVPDTL